MNDITLISTKNSFLHSNQRNIAFNSTFSPNNFLDDASVKFHAQPMVLEKIAKGYHISINFELKDWSADIHDETSQEQLSTVWQLTVCGWLSPFSIILSHLCSPIKHAIYIIILIRFTARFPRILCVNIHWWSVRSCGRFFFVDQFFKAVNPR